MLWMLLLGTAIRVRADHHDWRCPSVEDASCTCDLPRTLRCTATDKSFPLIAASLRQLSPTLSVSLLDSTIQNLEVIEGPLLEGVSLHGLVVSSGVLKSISGDAFKSLNEPLEALGLPNNQLKSVPSQSLKHLTSLTRLDLSHNLLSTLHENSFKGLSSLEFLDLSGNHLQNISSSAFLNLPRLKILRLQSNILNSNSITKLRGMMNLEKLDLSSNAITGPLNYTSFPRLPNLIELNLAHNQISSVAKDALSGLDNLRSLSLKYNMIDVLEDHAFRGLETLRTLDLAHNRMVAVSGASLAHLTKLESLDVSHNFLRALTADLVSHLTNLKELRLDDNDISMIAKDALETATQLETLSLAENPLNCDCSLSDFAEWMRNSSIKEIDKKTAVCATPPTLENGLVEELSPDKLVCGSQDDLPVNTRQQPMPVSGSKVTLQGYNFDGKTMYLLWNIETISLYHCESLFIYEELGEHEVLLEHNKLQCNSTKLADPHSLPVSLQTHHLQKGHNYRYCVVMVEKVDGDSALVLGCSEVIALVEHIAPQIISLKANLSTQALSVHAQIWPQNVPCTITFHISVISRLFKETKLNCSNPKVTIKGLPTTGPYKICAVISNLDPYCIWTQLKNERRTQKENYNFVLLLFSLLIFIFLFLAYILYRWLRHLLKRSKMHEQCFLPTPQTDEQHSRYVKLQATTKL